MTNPAPEKMPEGTLQAKEKDHIGALLQKRVRHHRTAMKSTRNRKTPNTKSTKCQDRSSNKN